MVRTSSTLILATVVLAAVSAMGNSEPKRHRLAKASIKAAGHVGAADFDSQRHEPEEFQVLDARGKKKKPRHHKSHHTEVRSFSEEGIFEREEFQELDARGKKKKPRHHKSHHTEVRSFSEEGIFEREEFQELDARGKKKKKSRQPRSEVRSFSEEEIFERDLEIEELD